MHICDGCHAGCCRSFAVPVTGADVLRIERDRGLDFWEFVCRWADPDGQIARRYAPHFHFDDEPETPFVIALLHDDSGHFAGTTKCRFLVEHPPTAERPLGEGRCGIHPSRPSACRAFPTKFDDAGDLPIVYEVPSHGRLGNDDVYALCPRPWTPADVDPLEAPADLVVARYEMKFFHNLATAWNRRPRAWSLFPEFLRMVYANRVGTEVPAEEAPATLPMRRAA